MKILCSKCKGTKKFRGMGCVISICPNCNGVGFIEAAKILDNENQTKKIKRIKRMKPDENEKE